METADKLNINDTVHSMGKIINVVNYIVGQCCGVINEVTIVTLLSMVILAYAVYNFYYILRAIYFNSGGVK